MEKFFRSLNTPYHRLPADAFNGFKSIEHGAKVIVMHWERRSDEQ